MKITAKKIMAWCSCRPAEERPNSGYTNKRIRELVPKAMTPLEILSVRIPIEDRFWVVLRRDVLPEKTLRLFAVLCAERALRRERRAGREPDPRSWAVPAP